LCGLRVARAAGHSGDCTGAHRLTGWTAAAFAPYARDMHFTEYDTRLAGCAVIADERQRILLAFRNEVQPPRWTMPGGGVEVCGDC